MMLALGVATEVVAELLGHSSPTITISIYAHGMAEEQGEARCRRVSFGDGTHLHQVRFVDPASKETQCREALHSERLGKLLKSMRCDVADRQGAPLAEVPDPLVE